MAGVAACCLSGRLSGCGMVRGVKLARLRHFRVFHAFRRLFIQSDAASLAGRRCSVMALTITVRSSFLTQGKGCVQLDDFCSAYCAGLVMHLTAFNHHRGPARGFINARPTADYPV